MQCIPIAAAAALSLLASAQVPSGPPVFGAPLSITNRYFPFHVGRVKHFEIQQGHTDGEELHAYLPDTRTFAWSGTTVACRVLQETSVEDGVVAEISRNYFAQADDGTVYYFGETVDNYDGGVIVNHHGSWLVGGPTGSDPAETAVATDPTVYMPARPEVGDVFKPEDLYPFVDESDLVVRAGITSSTPYGVFKDCIEIRESSRLDTSTETKWYAPGFGAVRVKEKGEVLSLEDVETR